MNLRHLADPVLHQETLRHVGQEREKTTVVLHHLKENDHRKLYCDYKCSSLFDYCVRLLNYSEGSAQRRIQAARLMQELPEIERKIEQGSLNLINIAQASTFFNQQGIEGAAEKKVILKQLENLSKNAAEKKLFELSGKEKTAKEERKRISKDKHKVTMVLSDETLAKLQKLKSLLGKNQSNEEMISFMADIAIEKVEKTKFKQIAATEKVKQQAVASEKVATAKLKQAPASEKVRTAKLKQAPASEKVRTAKLKQAPASEKMGTAKSKQALVSEKMGAAKLKQTSAIEEVGKTKLKQAPTPKESSVKSPPPVAAVGRVIPNALKREVYLRDKKCTNCGSVHHLNYDHRMAYALGGKTSADNLRLLCFQCNQRASIKAGLSRTVTGRSGYD